MKNLAYALLTIMMCASCVNSYNIQGSSNVSTLDGRMLYLKILKNNEFKTIDSCEVVHGQFNFTGSLDSVRMGTLFMDDESVMPVILEQGKIIIKMNTTQQSVEGTPLNDELFKFISTYNQIQNEQVELVRRHDRAIMEGSDMQQVIESINADAARLAKEEDDLVTKAVTDNFDNILGPSIFFMVTASNPYPQLTPWVEDIMSKATDKFKADPYVKDYYEKAQDNQQIMNGMKDVPAPAASQPQAAPAPTPHELAQPKEEKE